MDSFWMPGFSSMYNVYISPSKRQPKVLGIHRYIVQDIIQKGSWIPLECQAFSALLGKYARHADNRGPSEPCMPCVPRIPVPPLQVCLAFSCTYLSIMAGMHIDVQSYTVHWPGVHISCVPTHLSMPDIQLHIIVCYGQHNAHHRCT